MRSEGKFGSQSWGFVPALPRITCVAFISSLIPSGTQFPHLLTGDNSTHFVAMLKIPEVIYRRQVLGG